MDRFNFLNTFMQMLPLHLEKGAGGWGVGGGRILLSYYWPTASACVAYTVDWNTDRELRKLSC